MAKSQPPPEPVTCGYDYDIFISTPPEIMKCPICLLIVREPHQSSCCGRLFCQVCIQASQQTCPFCRNTNFTTILDKWIKRTYLYELQVGCENHDCDWKGELGKLHRHLSSKCKYVIEKCRYGCGKYYHRCDLQFHEQKECTKGQTDMSCSQVSSSVTLPRPILLVKEGLGTIVDWLRGIRQRYYSQVFYKLKQPHEWDVLFVVTKDDPAFKQFVKKEYSDCLDGSCQLIKLQEDVPHITLRADTACLDQWKMSEVISTQIDKEDIDYCTPERILYVPHCHFNFCWNSELPLKTLNMKIILEGVSEPNNFFRVILPPTVPPELVKSQELDYYRKQITDLKGKLKLTSTLSSELQHSQTLLMIEKKASLAKTQKIRDLEEKLKVTSTLSSDEKTLEREPLEEKKSKPVDEDKLKSDISDKMLILEEGWLVHLCVLLIAIVVGLFSDHSMSSIYPDGMQVVGERRFIVTGDDSAFTLDWVQFGVYIEIPKGSLPAGSTTELHIKAIIGGDFILPPDCYLVSGIYQISSSEQFKKNVTLHLPHAAIIKSEDEASYFRFYTADCSSGPPYEFKEMEGGYFRPHSNSAAIGVHHFSCYTIGATTIRPDQRYISYVFYKSISDSVKKWKMIFTITKDEKSFVEHVNQKYHDCHLDDEFMVQLQENATYLELTPESYSISSWNVYKGVSSQIERTVIESYDPKNNSYIPHCTYKFIWQSDSSPSTVNLEFMLVGTDRNKNFSVLLPLEDIESNENKGTDNVIKSIDDKTGDDQSVWRKGAKTVTELSIDDGTGGLIPDNEDLLYYMSDLDVTEIQLFCSTLGLGSECSIIIRQYTYLDDQKSEVLRKWKQLESRTWKEFIYALALLKKCVVAAELASEHSVTFNPLDRDDKRVLTKCNRPMK